MKIGIFTGTFDPFTIGHQNIAERALPMFDKLVIAVAMSKLKHAQRGNLEACGGYQGCFPEGMCGAGGCGGCIQGLSPGGGFLR